MQLTIWRGFRMELPRDWEMLQYSRDAKAGRIAFADRYRFRFEFDWRVVATRPDLQRLVGDYVSKIQSEQPGHDVTPRNQGPWRGLAAGAGEGRNTRYSRYFPGESCLVETVTFWPDGLDAGLERKILDSVAEERQTAPDLKRWKAFGMDIRAAGGMELERCRVDPAHACMTFAPPSDHRSEETYERLGFVPEWLNCSVREWLARQVPRSMAVESERDDVTAGHSIQTLRGTSYVNGLARILGWRRRHEAAAWVCPVDGRLYSVRRFAPEGAPEAPGGSLAGGRLSCCGDLGLVP